MYQAAEPETDETLRALHEALDEFHRIRDELLASNRPSTSTSVMQGEIIADQPLGSTTG
jgi:hypothetical protein